MRASTTITVFLLYLNICSIVLEETEWKYMSIITFDLHELELSENFMKIFHDKVSPVVLSESENIRPASDATLLICGNVNKLYSLIGRPGLPLWVSDIFYIILLSEFPPNYKEIFKDLWNLHKITNVLIIELKDLGRVISYNQFFDEIIEESIKRFSSNPVSSVRKITRHKMSDMNGYPIKVTMFPTRLKAIPQPDGTYTGSDGIILQTLAKHMNFTPIITTPPDGHRYGWKQDNGTFAGSLGEIVYNHADIAFNGVFMKYYYTEDIQFTNPVSFDAVCFVVPKSNLKPQWKTLLLVFDVKIWISLVITYVIVLFVWYALKSVSTEQFDVVLLGMDLYRILLLGSSNKTPTRFAERILMITVILFGFVVANSFQGSMIKFLSYEMAEQDISTIDELDQSGLTITSASFNLRELIETDDNPVMKRLTKKFFLDEKTDILGQIALYRNAASIGRKPDLEEKISKTYVQDNIVQLHIVEECPRSYYIAYLMPKKSPYLAIVNDLINYLVESGITNSWFIHAKPFTPLSDYHELARHAHISFSVEHVIMAFIILIFGLGFSYLTFLTELGVNAYRKRKVITNVTRSTVSKLQNRDFLSSRNKKTFQ